MTRPCWPPPSTRIFMGSSLSWVLACSRRRGHHPGADRVAHGTASELAAQVFGDHALHLGGAQRAALGDRLRDGLPAHQSRRAVLRRLGGGLEACALLAA